MPFGRPESLPTRPVLMANPTPASCLSFLLRSFQCVACTNRSLLLLLGESHSGLLSLVSAEFSTNKSCSRLWSICGLISEPTSRKLIVKGTTFVFFFVLVFL